MPPPEVRFVTVLVEEHPELPEGCCMRFKLVDEPRPVTGVRYESEASPDAGRTQIWQVEGARADGSRAPAWTATVEDSGAGTCMLVYGADHGLRLRPRQGGAAVAEAYLLLAPDALVD